MEIGKTMKTSMPLVHTILFGLCIMAVTGYGKPINSGVSPMAPSPVVMTIKDMPAKVLCGGSINCAIELKNTSDQSVSVPVLAPVSPVEFVFESVSDGSQRIISQKRFISWMNSGKTVPVMQQQVTSLKGGESLINKEANLAQCGIEPLLPGEYKVFATLKIAENVLKSPTVSLLVISPQIKMLESFFSPLSQNAYSVFIESKFFPRPAFFVRQSFSSNPANGSTGIPIELDETPQAIAAAEKIVYEVAGQWFCCQNGGKLTGIWGDLYVQPSVLGSPEIGLNSPKLLPQGFTIDGQKGTFFVTGGLNGNAVLQTISFTEKGASSGNPISITANQVIALKVQYNMPQKNFSVFWIEKSVNKEFVIKYGVLGDNTDGKLSNIHELFKTKNAPLALNVPSVVVKANVENRMTALFINKADKSLYFIQIAVGSPGPFHPVSIPIPPGPVDMWSTSPSYDYNPVIIVRSENHLLWLEVNGDNQWRTFAHEDQGISNVMLITNAYNEYWAQWVNNKTGFRFERVPYQIKPPM